MTQQQLDRWKALAAKVLDSQTVDHEAYGLAAAVYALVDTFRGEQSDRILTEAQAREIFAVEKDIFTLDGIGKVQKKEKMNTLLRKLYGWTPFE